MLVHHGHHRPEPPVGFESGVGPIVEVPDVAPADGPHHDIAASAAMRPPVEHHLVTKPVAVVGDGDVAVGIEAMDCQLGAPFTKRRRDEALLWVALTAILDQLDHTYPRGESWEQAAGLDRRELLRIADQDHLGPGSPGFLGQVGPQPRAKHPGFVDHEQIARGQAGPPGVEGGTQRMGCLEGMARTRAMHPGLAGCPMPLAGGRGTGEFRKGAGPFGAGSARW